MTELVGDYTDYRSPDKEGGSRYERDDVQRRMMRLPEYVSTYRFADGGIRLLPTLPRWRNARCRRLVSRQYDARRAPDSPGQLPALTSRSRGKEPATFHGRKGPRAP